MIARISRALHDALLALAAAEPEREVCGLLLGESLSVRAERSRGTQSGRDGPDPTLDCARDERIAGLSVAANVADDPARRFEIDPATLFAALSAERAGGPRIVGHYHSHPHGAAAPSARDAALADDPGRLWLIVGGGAVTAWAEVPGGSVHGAFGPVRLLVCEHGCETGHLASQGPA